MTSGNQVKTKCTYSSTCLSDKDSLQVGNNEGRRWKWWNEEPFFIRKMATSYLKTKRTQQLTKIFGRKKKQRSKGKKKERGKKKRKEKKINSTYLYGEPLYPLSQGSGIRVFNFLHLLWKKWGKPSSTRSNCTTWITHHTPAAAQKTPWGSTFLCHRAHCCFWWWWERWGGTPHQRHHVRNEQKEP